MAECAICGEADSLSFTCGYCGDEFCVEHQLPEKHDCPALQKDDIDGWFRKEVQQTPTEQERNEPEPQATDESEVDDSEGFSRSYTRVSSQKTPNTEANIREPVTKTGEFKREYLDTPGDSSPDVQPDGSLENAGESVDSNEGSVTSSIGGTAAWVLLLLLLAVIVIVALGAV